MKLVLVAGARANFMKIVPIIRALRKRPANGIEWRIVHTGQHYDREMSQPFFDDLNIPLPDFFLDAGSRAVMPNRPRGSWWPLKRSAMRTGPR